MSNNVERLGERIQAMLVASQKIVDGLADGERVQIKDIVTDVAKSTGEKPADVLGVVSLFSHNIEPEAHVRRGKKGGLVKGARKAPTPKKVKPVTDSVVDPADES